MRRKLWHALPNALFFLGVCIALVLAAAAAWADYEGMSYFSTGASYDPFNGLHCPVLLSRAEVGVVSSTFTNHGSNAIEPYFYTQISGPTALRRLEGHVRVGPGESRDTEWTVDAGDVDLGSFIMVRQEVPPVAGHRTRQATCGILTIPSVGLSGQSAVLLLVILSVSCMIAGLAIPAIGVSPAEAARIDREAARPGQRLLQSLGLVTAAALLLALTGWWLVAVVLCTISLLLLILSARYAGS